MAGNGFILRPIQVALWACVLVSTSQAQGLRFEGPSTDIAEFGQPYYTVTVQSADGNGSDSLFFFKGDTVQAFPGAPRFDVSVLSYALVSLAANIDLFTANAGETFADSSLAGFTDSEPSLIVNALQVPLGTDSSPARFYLGVRTHGQEEGGPIWRSSLGWLLLENTRNQGLRLVDSHVAYNVPSIVIGQVPESSTWSLAAVGMMLTGVLSRRRRRIG